MRKRVIVNGDDFGQSHGVNLGVAQAHEQGILTSGSLMVRWPAAKEAADYASSHLRLGVGLHLDFGEWRLVENQWAPLYQRVEISDAQALADEAERQLDFFVQLVGRLPTHMDSHQNLHMREPVRSVVNALAKRHSIPLRGLGTSYCGRFYGQDENGGSRPDWISVSVLTEILRSVTAEVTEISCHPAALSDLDTMYGPERLAELQTLCDPQLQQVVAELDLELVHFGMLR